MSRSLPVLAAVGAASVALTLGTLTSTAGAAAAPSTTDKTFMAANAQTNLAEITLGKLAMTNGQSSAVKQLAQKTMTDHQTAQGKLTTLAASLHVTLPTTPNPTQVAQATQLKTLTGPDFDRLYLQDQVAGHQLSITSTNTELSSGSDTAVMTYAKGYLPVAQMHLQMAQTDLAATSSGPAVAATGNGGQAASGTSGTVAPWVLLSITLALVGGAVVAADVRRRRVSLIR